MTVVGGVISDYNPQCFSWHDAADSNCIRCSLKKDCAATQMANLPPCYGQHGDEECHICLLGSACADVLLTSNMKGQSTMPPVIKIKMPGAPVPTAAPTPVVKQTVVAPKPVAPKIAQPKPVVDTEAVAEEVANTDYAAVPLADLRAHATERGIDSTGNKTELIKRLLQADAEASGGELEAPEQPKPNAPVAKIAATDFGGLLDLLNAGETLVFTRMSAAKWSVTKGTAAQVSRSKGLRGDAFNKTVLSDEYYTWFVTDAGDGRPWSAHTTEEKFAMAAAENVEWQHVEDARLNLMNMTEAFQIHRGFLKYKPEYQKPSTRAALKG